MADDQPVLASDAEREQSIVLLRDAVTSGRLTLEEFSERVGARPGRAHRPRSGGAHRGPSGARSRGAGRARGASPGDVLQARPARRVRTARPVLVAGAVRDDRARPPPGAARRARSRTRDLQPVRDGHGGGPARRGRRRGGWRCVRQPGAGAAAVASAGRGAEAADPRRRARVGRCTCARREAADESPAGSTAEVERVRGPERAAVRVERLHAERVVARLAPGSRSRSRDLACEATAVCAPFVPASTRHERTSVAPFQLA